MIPPNISTLKRKHHEDRDRTGKQWTGRWGFGTMDDGTGGPEDTGKHRWWQQSATLRNLLPKESYSALLSRLTKVVYSCLSHNIGTRGPGDRVWTFGWMGGRGPRGRRVGGVLKACRGMTWVPGWSEWDWRPETVTQRAAGWSSRCKTQCEQENLWRLWAWVLY